MIKRYTNTALIYAIAAMVFGVFYREFTSFYDFTGKTSLSIMHTHYFLLGMAFFLLLALLERSFAFSGHKNTGKIILAYHIGLNITGTGFLIRGLTQVWGTELSNGMDAAISGVAGIGHIILGVSLILLLFRIRNQAAPQDSTSQILIPRLPKKYLLLIAGIVWMFAGGNILRIGVPDFVESWHHNVLYVLDAFIVFAVFMVFIFCRLVQKHNARISNYQEEKVPFYRFFDVKSYLIMIFMITGGLLLRNSHVAPAIVIGILYCGIGASLEGAGILFIDKFVLVNRIGPIEEADKQNDDTESSIT